MSAVAVLASEIANVAEASTLPVQVVLRRRRPRRPAAPALHRHALQHRPLTGGRASVAAGMRRVGVMGGTFDPVHHGHLVAASEVAHRFAARRGRVRPHRSALAEARPRRDPRRGPLPHDRHRDRRRPALPREPGRRRPRRPDVHRRHAARPARRATPPTASRPSCSSSPAPTPSRSIASWHDSAELLELAHFVGVTRPGHALTDPGLPEGSVTLVEIPALAISSTDCRERVGARRADPLPRARRRRRVRRQARPLPGRVVTTPDEPLRRSRRAAATSRRRARGARADLPRPRPTRSRPRGLDRGPRGAGDHRLAVEVAGSDPAATIVPGVSDPAVPSPGEGGRAARRRAAEEAAEAGSQRLAAPRAHRRRRRRSACWPPSSCVLGGVRPRQRGDSGAGADPEPHGHGPGPADAAAAGQRHGGRRGRQRAALGRRRRPAAPTSSRSPTRSSSTSRPAARCPSARSPGCPTPTPRPTRSPTRSASTSTARSTMDTLAFSGLVDAVGGVVVDVDVDVIAKQPDGTQIVVVGRGPGPAAAGPAGGGVRDLPRAGGARGGAHGALRRRCCASPSRSCRTDATKVEAIVTGLGASARATVPDRADRGLPASSCTDVLADNVAYNATCPVKPIDAGGTHHGLPHRPEAAAAHGRRAAARRGAQARAELQGARARAERRRARRA